MNNTRTKNSFLILVTSSIRQVLTLLLTFISRTVFINILGAEYLGLNGLFSNILSILALTELGIGSAISFYLYQPLAENNIKRIQALMKFYKTCYRWVGLIIIGIGSCLMPFLPYLVNFEQRVPVNLYLVYFLYLMNTASSYLFWAYKQALITANQEQYKIEKINIAFVFINSIVDIIVLIVFKNYLVYLTFKLALVLVRNIVISNKVDKEYSYIKEKNDTKISKDEIKDFFKDIGSISLFRIGSTLFNSTDNIIISILLGTVVVGYYSNYYLIITQINIVVQLVIRSLNAGIGNIIVKETKEKQYSVYKQLNFAVYAVTLLCTVCLFQLMNSFVKIWVGAIDNSYIFSQRVLLFLCISFYFDNTTQVMNSFREGSGNFKTGRFLQLIGGGVNIVLSIVLGKLYGLEGIFAATCIGKGLITVTAFAYEVGNDVFENRGKRLVFDYYKKFVLMLVTLGIVWLVSKPAHMNGIGLFIVECLISGILPILVIFLIYRNSLEFKSLKEKALGIINKDLR